MNGRTSRAALEVPGSLVSLPPAVGPPPCAQQPPPRDPGLLRKRGAGLGRRLLLLGFETVGFSAAYKRKEATYVLKEGENYAACSVLALDLGHLFHSLKG